MKFILLINELVLSNEKYIIVFGLNKRQSEAVYDPICEI